MTTYEVVDALELLDRPSVAEIADHIGVQKVRSMMVELNSLSSSSS